VDPTDPIAELHVHALDKEVDPILAGSAEAMAVGPRTDVDARQADAPDVGHIIEGFEPLGDPTVIQPSVAFEAVANLYGAEQSAMNPIGAVYFGPHPSASGAMFMDQSSEQGSELGGFSDPCLPQESFERAVTSNWGGPMPMTTGAQTSATTTLTSTSVTCSAVGGPAHALYTRSSPHVGLTSVCPVQPAIVSVCRTSGELPQGVAWSRDLSCRIWKL